MFDMLDGTLLTIQTISIWVMYLQFLPPKAERDR